MTDLGELRLRDYWRVETLPSSTAGKREAGAEGSRTRPGKASGMEATTPTQQKG